MTPRAAAARACLSQRRLCLQLGKRFKSSLSLRQHSRDTAHAIDSKFALGGERSIAWRAVESGKCASHQWDSTRAWVTLDPQGGGDKPSIRQQNPWVWTVRRGTLRRTSFSRKLMMQCMGMVPSRENSWSLLGTQDGLQGIQTDLACTCTCAYTHTHTLPKGLWIGAIRSRVLECLKFRLHLTYSNHGSRSLPAENCQCISAQKRTPWPQRGRPAQALKLCAQKGPTPSS